MGWLSDLFTPKIHTTVQGITQRMLDDKDFVYTHKKATYRWIFDKPTDKQPLSEYIINYNNNALPVKFKRAYNWASNKNNYPIGLPTANISTNPIKTIKTTTQEYLKQGYGDKVNIVSLYVSNQDFYMTAWQKLINDFGYDTKTNELRVVSTQENTECYLKDAYLMVSDKTKQEYNHLLNNKLISFGFNKSFNRGKDITRQSKDYVLGDKDCLVVEYEYKITKPKPMIEIKQFEVDLSDVTNTSDVFDKPKDYLNVCYEVGNEVYLLSHQITLGGMHPLDNILDSKDDIGKYYPRIHIRINEKDTINHHDARIRDCTNKLFKRIGLDGKIITEQIQKSIGAEYNDCRGIYLSIGASVNKAGIDVVAEYCFRYFQRLFVVGDGKPIMQQVADNYASQIISYREIKIQTIDGSFKYKDTILRDNEFCCYYVDDKHIFINQQDDKYIQISVLGLMCVNEMGGYTSTHSHRDEHLVIPVDSSLMSHLTNKERQVLFHKCLHIQIMFVKITKERWWQTTGFKIVMVAIGIAITVATAGAGGMPLAAAFEMAVVGAAKGLMVSFAIQALTDVALELGLPPEIAQVLVIVANTVAIAYGAGFDLTKVMTAPNMMRLVNNSFDMYSVYLNKKIKDIQKEMYQIQQKFKSEKDRLNEMQKMLHTRVYDLSLEQLTSSFEVVNVFETPDLFLARHSGYNVVNASLALVYNHTQNNLHKPVKLYQTNTQEVHEVLLIT